MKQNVGRTDQLVRLALGAVLGLASLAILGGVVSLPMVLSPVLGVFSLVFLATAVTSVCGLYSALGISTK
ncbi:YgaP family membrane protein [Natronorubrum sulfidifaciens]|uniref:Inner membrane protein YgaP-like transmembrane domain-containing protein n=1 Tax=Natronorubrum sulfidifaciens JCM 14089 TaxID=1230460 RepID=L9WBH2_9EURY|nr:DUF2892 domain-containing protein [Natronorubrum sulfidifaciens]ELY45653.1 hypothetical protein C495_07730 [Natronorubrum sulfidifaciens JCM 14089]